MLSPDQFFKCLSDETRLRCLLLLYKQGQLCVCELTAALELSQPKISRHLAPLRHHGILQDTRIGQWVYYQINPALADWAMAILAAVETSVPATPLYQQDQLRLAAMTDRPRKDCC